jgi:hypothetical protein
LGGETTRVWWDSTVKKKGTPVLRQRSEYSSSMIVVNSAFSSGPIFPGNYCKWNASKQWFVRAHTKLNFALM